MTETRLIREGISDPALPRSWADSPKGRVRAYWERHPCGEIDSRGDSPRERLERHERTRYELEPNLPAFAGFGDGAGRDVLEVGVGVGADHLKRARSGPRSLAGVDLTHRAVGFTRERLGLYGLRSSLLVADAERLPFADGSFDLVDSWGVLHHSPDTARAVEEVRRVLRPGGEARVMIYHTRSLVGYMLWLRYGLLAGRPRRGLAEVHAEHLESPGTKAFTVDEAHRLFAGFSKPRCRPGSPSATCWKGASAPPTAACSRAWRRPCTRAGWSGASSAATGSACSSRRSGDRNRG
jgi:SAM-dependent methyltransferase